MDIATGNATASEWLETSAQKESVNGPKWLLRASFLFASVVGGYSTALILYRAFYMGCIHQ